MNPELSRRAARAINATPGVTLAQRTMIGLIIEGAQSFDVLPKWLKELILEAEKRGRRKATTKR